MALLTTMRNAAAAAALRIPAALRKLIPKAKPRAPFEIENMNSASMEELRTKTRMLDREVDSLFESIEPYEEAFVKVTNRLGMVAKINVLGYVAVPVAGWLASYYKSTTTPA